MALISSTTIIISISLFHFLLGYFFLVNPRVLEDQALVYIVGETMGFPSARSFSHPSPAKSFLSVALFLLGLGDLVSLSVPGETSALYYWNVQAPFRVLAAVLFCVGLYFGPPYLSGDPKALDSLIEAGGLAGLKNRLFFTFVFMEALAWVWAWATLREELEEVVQRMEKEAARKRYSR